MKKAIVFISFIISHLTYAQSSSNESTSNFSKNLLQKITPDRISHFSIIEGPSLDGDSSPNNFDGSVNTDGISSWHQVSFGYDINQTTRFIINPRFILERSEVNDQASVGKLDNPVMGITSTWFSYKNISFSGSINTVFAVFDEADREDGLEWNPGGFQTLNVKVNDYTNVGLWMWARYRYYRNNAERSRFPLFVSPFVSYDFNDKINTMAFYQVNGNNDEIDRFTWDPDETLNLSLGYRISKYLTVTPMITLYRETNFGLNEGNLNLWLSGSFL